MWLVPEAEIEHFISFVQHHHAQIGQAQAAALQMVAQPAGCADNDMAAGFQRPPLTLAVHAADAGKHARAAGRIEPGKFAMHLHGELPCRGNHQRQRVGRARQGRLGA